ncbi:ammonium transporter [Gammaproteobacteria bacterium]|nr:ammonium transporter [Gammaproteobacteria bacterium]RZO96225.1 MAG: ammonium transporter [Gammaproteobacteria bacterium]|tara:strand:- start:498 stop:1775 length:1278 start_codon:yes stop_codon:yes gene_type:complete
MIKKLLLLSTILFSVGISADELNSGDTAWILTSTALVLFMTLPGLSLFYAGLVRSKNAISVLMQCFAIACIVSVAWVVYGYSLAFTEGNGFIGGTSAFFLSGIGRDTLAPGTTMPHSLFVIFQMTFAIITPALVVGAFAERMKFGAMCLFSLLWFTAVYIPACHMIWGGGYLADVKDFAGGLVVHLTCGVGALVIAIMLGPRKGFPSSAMPPHNRTMVVTGAAMLWVGWFGFNAGSSWAADGLAGMAMLVTHISAATGALTWMAIEWIKGGKPTIVGIATGMVAGLATITPAAGSVGPEGALLIGIMAGSICFYATQIVKGVIGIDDSLDVFPVHGVGGVIGIIMVSFLGVQGGFLGSSAGETWIPMEQFIIQLKGIAVIGGWTAVASWLILKLISSFTPLRVSEEEEYEGLDIAEHEERGYDLT